MTFFGSLKAAWAKGGTDHIGLIAAGISYYAFLAMVPMLAVAVLLYGLIIDPETLAKHLASMTQSLPTSAAELIGGQMKSVVESEGGTKGLGLLAALALALFGARNGAKAVITALNIIFSAQDSRSFIRSNLLAMAITVGAIAALGIVAAAIAASSFLSGIAASLFGYAVVAAAGFGAASAIYRIAPNIDGPHRRAIIGGAAVFAVGWMLATAAFGYYVSNFGSYNATYGSLGAVVILLTWFYLSAFLLLLGAEVVSVRRTGT